MTEDLELTTWAQDVCRTVAGLAPAQSTALRLIYFERLSLTQAATRAGISVATFATNLAAGLRTLGASLLA